MTTTLTTAAGTRAATTASQGRGWILSGVGAGVAGIVSIVGSSLSGAVYDSDLWGDPEAIADRMSELVPQILLFHTATMVSCALLVVFAAGLHRQLRQRTGGESLLPGIASGGLMLVAVALLMGAGLTTEFAFAFAAGEDAFVPETVVFFGHWIGTVPWIWGGAGLAALAMTSASFRHAAYPRWIGWTSLVLGGLTTFFLVSPLQYMAGMTGPLWLTIVSIGLLRTRHGER